MEIVDGLDRCEALETLLHERLQAATLSPSTWQISCLLRSDNLLILLHSPDISGLEPSQVLPLVQATLKQENRLSFYPRQVYLAVNGQYYDLTELSTQKSLKFSLLYPLNQYWQDGRGKLKSLLKTLPERTSKLRQPSSFLGLLGMGILLLGSLYALTRPCVVGNCEVIPQARKQAENALTFLATATSQKALFTGSEELTHSVALLQSIPRWSRYHTEARVLQATYQQSLNQLSAIVEAVEIAKQATSLAQNSRRNATQWQELQQLWQKALHKLSIVPLGSPLYPLASVKRREFQQKSVSVAQQIVAEQQAISRLKAAENTAKIATMRENMANSFADWQRVYATWKTAIASLQEITPGTSAYQPSRQLLATYLPQLAQAGKRKQKEEFAANIYQKAIAQAKLAEKSELSQQWSQAVIYWRNALNSIQQVPNSTFQSTQAQPLLSTYHVALNRAQTQLKTALTRQKLQKELDALCSQPSQVCDYQIGDRIIQIKLTPSYLQQVWNTALQAKVYGNVQIQIELLNHLSRFEQSLQSLAKRTGKAIKVYGTNGSLMAVYPVR